ncbi:MAG: DUF5060 domain-containing protein [Phycisphaerales bacterium]|nr:MAG: DUF5060 domain-containing protein [Phycisphaerales bacterium]
MSALARRLLCHAIGVVLLVPAVASARVEITSISQNAGAVGLYEKFELTCTLSQDYDNPFDPDVVDVTVAFVEPDGSTVTIPAFFYQEYDYIDGRYVNGRNICWKARFAPSETGKHKVTHIVVVDADGPATIDARAAFMCMQSGEKGIIRTDQRDHYYLRHANRSPYLPVGHNVCWLPDGPADWQHYFTAMGAAGENWTRIWMTHFYEGQLLEWSSRSSRGYWQGVGRLSLEMGWKLDRIIELAEQNGIAIQLVLQHHGQFSSTTNPNWDQNPYNIANADADGGFLEGPEDFFTDEEAIRLTKYKYRYIVARWGYSSAILAWELWNEVQYTDGWRSNRQSVVAWHDEMAKHIASVDPFDHLITTSSDRSGFDAIWSLENIDVIQVHHYGSETVAFVRDMATRLAGYGKPIILGEFGVGRTGSVDVPESDYDELDEPYRTQILEGLALHNGMWSAFHVKSGAHLWWWDHYIEELGLYDQFSALARYAEGEDPAAHRLSKADLDTTGLPKWVLVSPGLTDFWAISTQTEFAVQSDGTVPGTEGLSSWLHGSSKDSYRSDPVFHIDLVDGDVLRIHVQEVSGWGNNSLRVIVDRYEAFSSSYANGSSGFVIEIPLPAGRHTVRIQNTGQDWFNIAGYEFINTNEGCLEFIGLSGADLAYIWVHDVDSRYGRTASGAFSDISVGLRGLDDGDYVVEFHETRGPGGIIQTSNVSTEAGNLLLALPDFARDIAVKVKPLCLPVGFDDLAVFCRQWLQEGAALGADLNNSNNVDFEDYGMFADHWLGCRPPTWPDHAAGFAPR